MALTKHLGQIVLLGVLVLPQFNSIDQTLTVPGFHVDQNTRVYRTKLRLNLESKTFEFVEPVEDNFCRFSPNNPTCEFQYEAVH